MQLIVCPMHIVHQSTTTEQSSTLLMTVSSHYYKTRRNPLQKYKGLRWVCGWAGVDQPFSQRKIAKILLVTSSYTVISVLVCQMDYLWVF